MTGKITPIDRRRRQSSPIFFRCYGVQETKKTHLSSYVIIIG